MTLGLTFARLWGGLGVGMRASGGHSRTCGCVFGVRDLGAVVCEGTCVSYHQ